MQNFKELEENIEMNIDLPEITHFNDFYIWFNKGKKEEYYSTPLYFYKAHFSFDYNDKDINSHKNRTK